MMFFGSVTVPGSAARHPRVLVAVAQESECLLLLETLASAGHVASGLTSVDLARAVIGAMRFDVLVIDRAMAREVWTPLVAAVGRDRVRVVFLTDEATGGIPAAAVEGVQTIARPLTLQQLLGAVGGAVATHPRLADTQEDFPVVIGSA